MKAATLKRVIVLILMLALGPQYGRAYSVLTHEALIDAAWDNYIAVLLKQKYKLTPEQLKDAHAYAYGGAVAPDMGYYPFGSKLFTNLVHYVRSGDYVMALLEEAHDANEYAFALGSLCHYFADIYGHHLGVNVSVPIVYPKVKEKYGPIVTYEDDPASHKRVEFAFDVTQTAKGNYATQAYHDFIGFKVADSVMERAFYKTYGMHLSDVFKNFSRAVNTFRWSVKEFFPELTRAAWATKRSEIEKSQSGMTGRKFRYHMKRINYNKQYGRDRDKPGFFAHILAGLIRILPKIGPLKPLKFTPPGPVAEKYYIQSFDTVLIHYDASIKKMFDSNIHLNNQDFDTGKKTTPGEYKLADKTYCDLVLKLQDLEYATVNPTLKQNILYFFENAKSDTTLHQNKDWDKVSKALSELQCAPLRSGTR